MAGLLMIVISIFIGVVFGAFRHVNNQVRTKATIIDLEFDEDEVDHSTVKAIAEYVVDGKQYTVKSSHRSKSYLAGGKVTVCYNRQKPEEAFVRTSGGLYIGMAVFFLFGVAVIIQTYFLSS